VLKISSRYYNKRLDRAIDEIDIYAFDIEKFDKMIEAEFEKIYHAEKIEIVIRALLPDVETEYVQKAYAEGKVKSHELKEAISLIQERIMNSMQSKVKNYNFIFELYDFSKFKILLNYTMSSVYFEGQKRLLCEVAITIYTPAAFEIRQLKAIPHIFITESINLSEKLNISVYDQSQKRKKAIFKINLTKKTKESLYDYLTKEDKEDLGAYYSRKPIQQGILHYFFPEQNYTITRITLDKLQEHLPVKKSLRVQINKNEWKKITEIITPHISNQEFTHLIEKNDIAGFYCGTVTEDDTLLCYLIFDIDVSDFFRSLFSAQTIWELLLELTSTLIETIQDLGVEGYPEVKFSGSRGLHIIYRYEQSTLIDKYRGINLKNLFYRWPGLWDLIKNQNSPIKSKTSFSKLFADSIVVYMLFRKEVSIPEKIKEVIGENIHQKDIFKISVFNSNESAILIDTSPNSKGVFRTAFSVHPSSKLVSLPIFNTEKGELIEKYERFKRVKKDSEIEHVLEYVDSNSNKDLESLSSIHKTAIITKENLERLLKPGPLLPAIAFYLRFGRRFVTERSLGSFYFWYNHFELQLYYQYIEHAVLRVSHTKSAEEIFSEIKEIVEESYLYRKKDIIDYVRLYLIEERISYPLFEDRIKGLYYFEFYNRVKTEALEVVSPDRSIELLKDDIKLKGFLQKLKHLNLIITEIISSMQRNEREYKDHEVQASVAFKVRLQFVYEYIRRLKHLEDFEDQKEKIYLNWKYLTMLFNFGVMFYKEFKRFDKISLKRK
jgi:hypothetical protein